MWMGLMSPRRRAGDRGDGSRSFMIGLAITLILLLGLAAAFFQVIQIMDSCWEAEHKLTNARE